MKILPECNNFVYTGRIDFTDPKEPLFIYAGSMAETVFTGTSVGVYIRNEPMGEYSSVGALVDNVQYKFDLKQDNQVQFIKIAEGLAEGEHSLVLFKRQAAAHYFRFCGIETDEGAKAFAPQKCTKLNIEVFGDSVSAGEVIEAVYREGCIDPENHRGVYDNSWFSYPLTLGRRLNAQVFNNSQGGIALLDKTGYFNGPETEKTLGVESTYDKLSYVPYSAEGMTKWDFERFTPDLVIFAIGQNDSNPVPEVIDNSAYMENWKRKYKEILLDLKQRYGKQVKVLMILTVLMHDPKWDKTVDEIAEELGDDTVRHYVFKRCGKATPGHPRITEQTEMAEELSAYIGEWFGI